MATNTAGTTNPFLVAAGDFRWVRLHVSAFAVGAVVMASVNLLIGGSRLWSLTAIGIWTMLLIVHVVVLAIARLSVVLMADEDDEIVLLPLKDAVIVEPKPDPTATWDIAKAQQSPEAPETSDIVSWQIATDAAQVIRQASHDSEQSSL